MAILQNENVSRPATSERMYVDLRRPDRRTPKRVLVSKTFDNVHTVWSLYIARNKTDIRYVIRTVCNVYIMVWCRPMCDEEEGHDDVADTDVADTDVADTDDDLDDGDALESSDEIDDYDDSSMCMFTPLK